MTTARATETETTMLPNTTERATPLAFGSTVGLGPLPARWYCVSNDGMATLCKDQEDAQANARHCDLAWPKGAPHRAVMLGDVSAERERCAAARPLNEDDRPLVTRILQALPEQPPTPYSGWARYKNECADFVDRLRAALGPN